MHTPPELAAAIAAAGIMVCPTLGHDLSCLAGPPSPAMAALAERSGVSVEDRLAQVGDLHRGGVALISGTDSGINPVKPTAFSRRRCPPRCIWCRRQGLWRHVSGQDGCDGQCAAASARAPQGIHSSLTRARGDQAMSTITTGDGTEVY